MKTGLAFLLLVAALPAWGRDIDTEQTPRISAAFTAIRSGQPQAGLDTLETVLKAYDAEHAGEKRRLYCGMSLPQTLAYMAMAAKDKVEAVALAPGYCTALFLKGYALIDLNRIAEARAAYQQAVALAPMHSHFLTELGQSYRYDHDWAKMLETCTRAESVAALANEANVTTEQGLAWRCQGYALVEQGEFDAAEALYRKCLELDPADGKAKGELDYIAQRRRKAG